MLSSRRPEPALARHVEMLWHYSGRAADTHKERVLPTGRFQLIVDLDAQRGTVSGIRQHYTEIEPARITCVLGIVFRPGGTNGLLQGGASEFQNRIIPAELAWGPQLTRLIDRVHGARTVEDKFHSLERLLLMAMRRSGERRTALHPAVEQGLADFHLTPSVRCVADVAKSAGLSRRRFSQLFREQVGMTPKLYCRLRRFRQVVRRIPQGGRVDWVAMAVDGGYSDQAHLAHEFRDFSGLSPGKYLASLRPFPNHVRVG